ncbi:hypothetical protein TURU_014991 [Turdus rufiventris]|nr:hypothetical protein TURU_014991 [Turdus rufiventris]
MATAPGGSRCSLASWSWLFGDKRLHPFLGESIEGLREWICMHNPFPSQFIYLRRSLYKLNIIFPMLSLRISPSHHRLGGSPRIIREHCESFEWSPTPLLTSNEVEFLIEQLVRRGMD